MCEFVCERDGERKREREREKEGKYFKMTMQILLTFEN